MFALLRCVSVPQYGICDVTGTRDIINNRAENSEAVPCMLQLLVAPRHSFHVWATSHLNVL